MSYLTDEELQSVQALPKDTPYVIKDVSNTQFSVARYYGGMTYNVHRYTYNPITDECVRNDVIKLVESLRKLKAKAERTAAKERQGI